MRTYPLPSMPYWGYFKAGLCLLAALLLAGCASQVPLVVRESPAGGPNILQVQANPSAYVGRPVRWGGIIVGVDNHKTETTLQIVSRPLNSEGRPRKTDATYGRFLARAQGFLDPAVYAPGREITVAGILEPSVTGTIGNYQYTFPVIKARMTYLWPPRPRYPRRYYDPYWYNPWYNPWYPFDYDYPW